MSASTATALPAPREAMRAPTPARPGLPGRSWLFNPWLDLLVVANLFWPLLIVVLFIAGGTVCQTLSFWMIYFLSTPHRWITLVLVFFDPDRYRQHARSFVGIAAVALLLCAGAYLIWGLPGVYVLLAVDFLWNAWHFASQHAGILRIYGRLGHGEKTGNGTVEKILVRVFVLFVLVRLASLTLPHETRFGDYLDWLRLMSGQLARLDLLALLLPLALLVREFCYFRPLSLGRCSYLLSVCGLYGLLLGSVHAYQRTEAEYLAALVLALAAGISIFHSTEYLAIVTWAATRKKNPRGVLAYLVPRWAFTLVLFIALLGLSALLLDSSYATLWLLLNLMVSFLHYAYDGIIWKARKPVKPVVIRDQ